MTQLVSAERSYRQLMAEDTIAELVGTITGILIALIIMMSLPVGIGILTKIAGKIEYGQMSTPSILMSYRHPSPFVFLDVLPAGFLADLFDGYAPA
eukprot:s1699_g15.t1